MLCFFVDEDFSLLPISCGTVLALLICFLKLLLLDTDDPKLRDDEQSLMDWSDLLMAGVGRGEHIILYFLKAAEDTWGKS